MFQIYMFLIFWYLLCTPDDVDFIISTANVLEMKNKVSFYSNHCSIGVLKII